MKKQPDCRACQITRWALTGLIIFTLLAILFLSQADKFF